jgi:SAM-dependent methyltransferase
VTNLQHPDSRAFETVAEAYERARPDYPAEILAWLGERLGWRPGRTILDLGAGTGKLTRPIAATGARVIALEPGDQMRAQLARATPRVEVLAAGAESIPLEDDSVDAATAGQSFHWFRFGETVGEVQRVVRQGGGLGLVWNERDPGDELQAEISVLLAPFVPPDRPRPVEGGWRDDLERSGVFGPIEERQVRFADELDSDGLVARIATISFVAAAAHDKRARLDAQLRNLVTSSGERVQFAYLTTGYVTFSAG